MSLVFDRGLSTGADGPPSNMEHHFSHVERGGVKINIKRQAKEPLAMANVDLSAHVNSQPYLLVSYHLPNSRP